MVNAKVVVWTLFAMELNTRNAACLQSNQLPKQCRRITFSPSISPVNSALTSEIREHQSFTRMLSSKPVRDISLMAINDDSADENFIMKGLARRNLSPKITEVQKLDDFLGFIEEDERLCVVKVYASWCKSCHKFGMKYKKLATEHCDMLNKDGHISEAGSVRFAAVEYGRNTPICKALGIRKLPYVIIHKASVGKIAEFSCGPKYFEERLVSRLDQYLEMSDEELQFEQKMEGGTSLGNDILSQLSEENINQL